MEFKFNLKNILKALLFSTAESLSIKDIQTVMARYHQQLDTVRDGEPANRKAEGVAGADNPSGTSLRQDLVDPVLPFLTAAQIRETMEIIAEELVEQREVYRLVEGPNGYRLALSQEFASWVRLLRNEPKPQKLSPAAMETLAIIAYRQPITRAEIEAIRGVSSDSALNTLLEHELILVKGRADLPGRPLQYGSTDRFLELCTLRSIEELPASDVLSPNHISDWIRQRTGKQLELSDVDMGLPEEEQTTS